jgi:hypothetical protein
MKLRIKGNSLRLRITPSDLTRLLATGRIQETIHFASDPDAHLTYALEHTPQAASMAIRYTPGEVIVQIPSAAAEHWAGGQDVGIYGQSITTQGTIDLAVEKDFACIDKSDAENVDTFHHPKQGAVC